MVLNPWFCFKENLSEVWCLIGFLIKSNSRLLSRSRFSLISLLCVWLKVSSVISYVMVDNFILKINRLPLPIPADHTATWPPHFSTIYFTIVSPNPMPSLLTSAVRCSLPNCEKSLGKSSFAIPAPESTTCTTMH